MKIQETHILLRDYVEHRSESAFRQLVERYVGLVYSTALRRVGGNHSLAEDIVQQVFSDFAEKARSLESGLMLGGWLHHHCCYVSNTFLRSENRRQLREQQAAAMSPLHQPEPVWNDLAPIVDQAIDELDTTDRSAIVLRFFDQKDLRSIGEALGLSEDAAQKRVSRALDKLRGILQARGVTLSLAGLSTLLSANIIEAVPASLSATVTRKALNQGSFLNLPGLFRLNGNRLKLAAVGITLLFPLIFSIQKRAIQRKLNPSERSVATRASSHRNFPSGALDRSSESNSSSLQPLITLATGPIHRPDDTNTLELRIIAADSGQPIPNPALDVWVWENQLRQRYRLAANREGVCVLRFNRICLTHLRINTETEGFADTRLEWFLDRGMKMPSLYTLQLIRPVWIGGRVTDTKGNPIEGAEVVFAHDSEFGSDQRVETHPTWAKTVTDPDGRWAINRIAPETLSGTEGIAENPAYLSSVRVQPRSGSPEQMALRQGTHVFTLENGLEVQGIVMSETGEPVRNASVTVGPLRVASTRFAKTGLDGTFTVRPCRSGETLVTAEADGYAASTKSLKVEVDMEPVTLKLVHGKPLRLRVMNRENAPIGGARVCYNHLDALPREKPLPQTHFCGTSEDSGLAVWTNAPDFELNFFISAVGYMLSSDQRLRPREKEYVVTLDPALRIVGRAFDASTGKAIPTIMMTIGSPRGSLSQSNYFWPNLRSHNLTFEDGAFDTTLSEPVIHGSSQNRFVFRFQSDGYKPFISRVIDPSERLVQFEVRLEPGISSDGNSASEGALWNGAEASPSSGIHQHRAEVPPGAPTNAPLHPAIRNRAR
jgi:RNA polymerase sigma factor (sigma-70 family)